MQYDIVLIGCYFFDQIFTGMPEFPVLGREIYATDLTTTGGAMFITATALTRLGVHVGWPVYFGNDSYSQFVYDLARQEGIDMSLANVIDRPYRLVTASVPFQGERAFITYADPEPAGQGGYCEECLEESVFAHLHLGSFLPRQELQPLTDKARSKGATVSMDCQDGQYLQQPYVCLEALELVDVFMPNAREAKIITAADSVEKALRALMNYVRVVVIKDGANGAWVGSEGEIIHLPVVSAGTAVDTTGAGDCFNAGFLYGYVIEKAPLKVCAQYGNICGGCSVTAVGGATAAPTYEQLMMWMAKQPAGE